MANHKLELVVETAQDGRLWGRIQVGEDLLTSSADTQAELEQNLNEQILAFYQMQQVVFEIKYDMS